MHRNTTASTRQNSTPSLSSHRNTRLNPPPSLSPDLPEASSSLPLDTKAATTSKYNTPLRITQITRSAKSVQGGDLLSDLLPPDHSSDGDDGDLQDLASTYRTALLSAKAKESAKAKAKQREISPDNRPAAITADTLNMASLKKKSEPAIQYTWTFLLSPHTPGSRRRRVPLIMHRKLFFFSTQKYSPGKRRLLEERREEGIHARKGAAVVAKREKINPKKPKKKKVSRVQKCKIEKRQREMLALQLLLKRECCCCRCKLP
ncbi:hypothetical protein GWK47_034126 [Chionoecetes opilio]|uniref:Uncharacterized protein n=1 Tax=Chionoecetes opilio TaxID=41210 RepID=A0A8J4YPA9_CHIOP|nr:hypothetical protein GWK47_034126 [Chionoecetes opilio]